LLYCFDLEEFNEVNRDNLNLGQSIGQGQVILDATMAVSLIGRESSHELPADRHNITFIRLSAGLENERDKEKVLALRKVNVSFNPLHQAHALDGLDQV
jgi:hypothetical protein